MNYFVKDAYGTRFESDLDMFLLLPMKGQNREIMVMKNLLGQGVKLVDLPGGAIIVSQAVS